MFTTRRPLGRFFCCVVFATLLLTGRTFAASARTTRVADTVFRANGTPAQGTVLISWPAFTSATGEAIAAGRTTVTVGPNGAIDVPLVPNTGSTPSSFYTVVLKLDDGATATEYWTVPSTGATTVAAIRSKVVPASVAAQFVGRDYVDTADSATASGLTAALAAKASDTAVVHYAGDETITGAKTFSASPVVPTPTAAAHAANRGYVDTAVQGSFANVLSANPAASQVITQPAGTSFQVNRADVANLNGLRSADRFPSIQSALTDAGSSGAVVIPPTYTGADNFTNPSARPVLDLRRLGDFRGGDISVKDFGARGDGGTYGYTSCTAGSGTITSVAASQGRLPKVGDILVAAGCGPSGADLQCTVSGGTATTGTAYGSVICGGGVTAATTLSPTGARWGATVDDTPAFAAAMDYCKTGNPNGGCRIKVPAGVYFISNLVFPAKAGIQNGMVMLEGVGRGSSWIIGIGADQSPILKAPDSSVPTHVSALGILGSYDYNRKKQIGMQWAGGQYHTFENNSVQAVYRGLQAANTWINLISNNNFYGPADTYIEFGGSAGTGPVNATRVVYNEFGAGFTGHAIWTHTNNASYENTYAYNSIENDNPPFDTPVDISDNGSFFLWEYVELSVPSSGYYMTVRGGGNVVENPFGFKCTWVTTYGNTFKGTAGAACSGQTYTFKNDGNGSLFYGVGADRLSNSNAVVYGSPSDNIPLSFAGLKVYGGSTYWSGRVDIAGNPFGKNNTAGNPAAPSGVSSTAVVPYGSIFLNNSFGYGTQTSSTYSPLFLVCKGASGYGTNCSNNPMVGSEWWRVDASSKARIELSAAPASGTWTVGDFVWNTNPATNKILGWLCTVAGTPGTWQAVNAFDPASPTAIGATSPSTVKATTVNATAGYQVNGTALVSSCGTTSACANTAVTTARTLIGSVTLASGSATVTGISPAFASTTSFVCTCTDQVTTPAACTVQNTSTSSITVKGSATDIVNYICIGN